MWERNRDVLFERWPEVLHALETAPVLEGVEVLEQAPAPTLRAQGIQLTSAYDRVSEAREQAALIGEGSAAAWVYGLGFGDLPRELLARSELLELNVVLLNRALGRVLMESVDQVDWLRDPRVRLVLGESQNELRTPFAALPAELLLAEDSSARIRDLVQLELAAPWVAECMEDRGASFERAISRNHALLAVDGDVGELFDTRAGKTIYVAGAGPTLEDAFELLHGRDETLIAVDGALRPLLGAGVRPDVVVSIDAHEDGMSKLFDADLSRLEGSSLVYFPVVPRAVLERWHGRRLAAYGEHPRWSRLSSESPRERLWGAGTVTHVAVDLAVRMGAVRVVLLGCDFGFARGRTHARGNPYARDCEAPVGAGAWVLDVEGNRLPTLPNLCGYLRDLERYIAARPGVEFVNASRAGAAIAGTRTPEEVALGS